MIDIIVIEKIEDNLLYIDYYESNIVHSIYDIDDAPVFNFDTKHNNTTRCNLILKYLKKSEQELNVYINDHICSYYYDDRLYYTSKICNNYTGIVSYAIVFPSNKELLKFRLLC